uniref:Uncharacterized mitochondrial protein AtMg00810-like n=1 Tax=Tanacetum cinerariifolium TaxID=118510 RepID=A0A699H2N4_TANCI|nr:uncharacterized mitochondrial protein AtMg00810-like [Tanacetum cinerariifolium]
MHSRFEMSLMREMKFFLGLQIYQSSSGICINQAKYTLEILHKHGMDKVQSIGTPMATKPKLDADLSGNPVDQTDYCSKIRSLMYLTSSRLDIVQAWELLLAVGIHHCQWEYLRAFYFQQSSLKLDAAFAIKFLELNALRSQQSSPKLDATSAIKFLG